MQTKQKRDQQREKKTKDVSTKGNNKKMRKVFFKRKRSNEVVKESQELNLRRPKTKM